MRAAPSASQRPPTRQPEISFASFARSGGTAGSRRRYHERRVCTISRPIVVETLVNEFWTSKQASAHSLHEVSYRACFKPQLPRFFMIGSPVRAVVYDPFMGPEPRCRRPH